MTDRTSGTMANPIVAGGSSILHHSPNVKVPVIICNDGPIFETWKSNKKFYKQAMFATSSYAFFGGICKQMYMPYNDDYGVLTSHSTIYGDFKCVFQVFIDHEMKMLAWGRGYIEFERDSFGHETYRKMQKQFISPNDIKRAAREDYSKIVSFLTKLFPSHRIVNWSMRFMHNVHNFHKKTVISIPFVPTDIQAEILKHLLPAWPAQLPQVTSHTTLLLGIQILESWENKWIHQNENYTANTLPHHWYYTYVMDVSDVIDLTNLSIFTKH